MRSSGRERYPSPLQLFVAISCCASSRRSSPNKHLPRMHEFSEVVLPEQTIPASRARKATCVLRNAYRVIRGTTVLPGTLQQYKGYTLKSAYHTVVDEEGWAGHVDGVQKTGILSVPDHARQQVLRGVPCRQAACFMTLLDNRSRP